MRRTSLAPSVHSLAVYDVTVVASRNKLEAILNAGDFEALIGASETDWFECKSQPYQIDNDEAKRELAKDVSSFANATGGKIVIGLRTKPSTTHFGDEIEKVRSFPQTLLVPSHYLAVLDAWVYPAMLGVSVTWLPSKIDSARGVVVIDIPAQPSSAKPFLVVRTFDGAKFSETFLGYAERKGDASKPLGIAELQAALRSGLTYDSLIRLRFEALETLVKGISSAPSQQAPEKQVTEQIVEKRLEAATAHGTTLQGRSLLLAAVPSPPGELKSIFTSSEGSLRRALENPPRLREHGWDLSHFDSAKIMKGEAIRVADGERKVVDLYRDGTMIAAAPADGSFLAWGRKEDKEDINPLALVEYVYSFLNFYSIVLKDFASPPVKILFRVKLRNMHLNGKMSTLGPFGLNSHAQQFGLDERPASDDEFNFEGSVAVSDFEPTKYLIEIIKEIYLWFGIEEAKIPYFKASDAGRELDIEAITKIS